MHNYIIAVFTYSHEWLLIATIMGMLKCTSRIFGPHQRAGETEGYPGHSDMTPATRTLDGDATWHLESCGTQED